MRGNPFLSVASETHFFAGDILGFFLFDHHLNGFLGLSLNTKSILLPDKLSPKVYELFAEHLLFCILLGFYDAFSSKYKSFNIRTLVRFRVIERLLDFRQARARSVGRAEELFLYRRTDCEWTKAAALL